jgi:hypothetical protein
VAGVRRWYCNCTGPTLVGEQHNNLMVSSHPWGWKLTVVRKGCLMLCLTVNVMPSPTCSYGSIMLCRRHTSNVMHHILYCTQIRNGFQDCVRKTTTNKQRMVTLPVCGVLDLLCGPSPRQSEDRSRRNLCHGAEDREGAERVGERGNTSVENSHPNNAIVQASSGCATSSASLLQIWVKVLYAQDVWDFQGITKQCVDDAWLQGLTSFGHYLKFG